MPHSRRSVSNLLTTIGSAQPAHTAKQRAVKQLEDVIAMLMVASLEVHVTSCAR